MTENSLEALPASWKARLARSGIIPITAGMSGASVFRVTDAHVEHYLKIGTGAVAKLLRREIERTEWLASAGIRVPTVIDRFTRDDVVAAVMTALDGQTAEHIGRSDRQGAVTAIARAFAALHALPIATCPFEEALNVRLARARDLVRAGDIDPADFDERNAGVTPEELYARLAAGLPEREDCVVVHGDATLSNLILGTDGQVGFVDCGHAGRADRYVDLALVVGEIEERLGRDARSAFTHAYGRLRWDEWKAAFYRDLYEFF